MGIVIISDCPPQPMYRDELEYYGVILETGYLPRVLRTSVLYVMVEPDMCSEEAYKTAWGELVWAKVVSNIAYLRGLLYTYKNKEKEVSEVLDEPILIENKEH